MSEIKEEIDSWDNLIDQGQVGAEAGDIDKVQGIQLVLLES